MASLPRKTRETRPRPFSDAGTDQFISAVYDELRLAAQRQLDREPAGHSLQPTALVHEAYLRLLGGSASWESRVHFYNAAARAMRHILVDHARRRRSRRGSDLEQVASEDTCGLAGDEVDLILLDEALSQLEGLDPVGHQIVHLRFFVGLGIEEIAKVTDLSARTVKREWRSTRLWLFQWIRTREDEG